MVQTLESKRIAFLQKELQDKAGETFKNVQDIWETIGFGDEEIMERCTRIKDYIYDTFDHISESELKILRNIQVKIESYKQKVNKLENGLNIYLTKMNDSNNNNSQELNLTNKQRKLLEQVRYFKNILFQLDNIKEERKKTLNEFKNREKELCNLLNQTEYSIEDTSLIDQNDIENIEHHINDLSIEKHKRINIIKQYQEDMDSISHQYQLKIDSSSSLNKLVGLNELDSHDFQMKLLRKEIPIDDKQLDTYRNSIEKLITRRDELIESIDSIRTEIAFKWNKFELTNPELADMVLNKPTYNQQTYELLLKEHSRCCYLKNSKIKTLIEESRKEIVNLWDLCMFKESQKADFILKFNEVHLTEDLLEDHKKYLASLADYAFKYENLFKCLKEWETSWELYKEFEIAHSDPNRFHQRGYSSLNEQRERESYINKLNKLKKQLITECEAYCRQQGEQFLYNGFTIGHFIDNSKADFEKEKETMRKERQAKKEPLSIGSAQKPTKSLVKNFLTPVNDRRASSISSHKSLNKNLSTLRPITNSISSSSAGSAKSINSRINLDKTPNSSKMSPLTTSRKISNINNSKSKSSLVQTTTLQPKKEKRRSIKDIFDKCKKSQRRSKIFAEVKLNCGILIIPELKVTNEPFSMNSASGLITANILNRTNDVTSSSSGIQSSYLSISSGTNPELNSTPLYLACKDSS